ncbi:MAG: class II D-tagatose-bisphosphate aldolase, non-catalytic subunit, partial [Desulfobacterales bacterium]|nr:class II D-tagatose-bisphosphate aldolase, non-catalytic subunit [Desulfobacterales bacterium]
GHHDHLPGSMTYEIHATDYQAPQALENMARDHFALMKTGPCLTHAFREAVFALAHIEDLLLAGHKTARPSKIKEVLCRVMDDNPGHWRSHHSAGSASDWTVLFGYLDRVRYYWARPEVKDALARLLSNLDGRIPPPLISQYLPKQYREVSEGLITPEPARLIRSKIRDALFPYASACGLTST